MTTTQVYLDHNAGAPVSPDVARAVARALACAGNPSSVHGAGRAARRILVEAREAVARLAGTAASRIVFTSGGTEANNTALRGLVESGQVSRLVVSAIEHPSVRACAEVLAEKGVRLDWVPCGGDGVVTAEAVRAALADGQSGSGRTLVCVMLANNETGVIQPVADIAQAAHAAGALVLCDAVQAAGKLPVDFAALDVDMMSLSAHKFGGPKGVGALIARDGIDFEPLLVGGGQEFRHRAGTENLPGIAGMGRAAEIALDKLGERHAVAALRDGLEREIAAVAPKAVFYGASAPRLDNTACFAVAGFAAEKQVIALDLAGICVSAGAACSSGKVAPSHVLTAMGADPEEAACAIRVSLGPDTARDDIDKLVEVWRRFYQSAGAKRNLKKSA